MSDPIFQNSGLCKYYKYTGLLVVVGLILRYKSQVLYFIVGNKLRILSHVFGLISIVQQKFLMESDACEYLNCLKELGRSSKDAYG